MHAIHKVYVAVFMVRWIKKLTARVQHWEYEDGARRAPEAIAASHQAASRARATRDRGGLLVVGTVPARLPGL